jgi:hypothetical protein
VSKRKKEAWSPVPPHRRADVVDVMNALFEDGDNDFCDGIWETLVIDPLPNGQVVQYSAGRSRLRVKLAKGAPPVETRRFRQNATHREVAMSEVVAIEWRPRREGE